MDAKSTKAKSSKGLLVAKILGGLFVVLLATEQFLFFVGSQNFQPQVFRAKAQQYDVEIIRDGVGVPHIYGANDFDVAFGLGYAQAQDRLEDIEEAIIMYRGESAEFKGSEGLTADYLIRLLGVWEPLESGYVESQLPVETLALLQAYVDGVNAYAGTDVKRATPELYPITRRDLLAGFHLQHLFFYGFDEQLKTKIAAHTNASGVAQLQQHELPIGSNAIAIAPQRTETNSTLLLWNSHQPLRGPLAWYEAHIESATGWQFYGGFFPGSPVPFIGFNNAMGWGVTVNKPNLLDVFELPESEVESYGCAVGFKIYRALRVPLPLSCYRDGEGRPVLEQEGRYFQLRYAGAGEYRQIDQWYQLSQADSVAQWRSIFAENHLSSFAFIAADATGDIHYRHNALMPNRSEGELWTEYLPADSVPAISNPSSGVLVATNQSPWAVSQLNDSLTVVQELDYEQQINNRAIRAHELLGGDQTLSFDELVNAKYDVTFSAESLQVSYLRSGLEEDLPEYLVEASEVLKAWDFSADEANRGAALGVCMLEAVDSQFGRIKTSFLKQLDFCDDLLRTNLGTLTPRWGQINRLVDGGNFWGVSGAPDTLRAMHADADDFETYGIRRVVAGDGLHGIVEWRDGALYRAEVISPYGQSIARLTPFRTDQTAMFINRELRPVLMNREEIERQATQVILPKTYY
ncbi:MAG: penicillin acylase family protein [Pseudomonadales bacterium]|jgi:penicillin amidase/acyl-homoserine-lactone acylase